MGSGETQLSRFKSYLSSAQIFLKQRWWVAVLVALLCVLLTSWNGRYDAGYKAGAGEGAVYKTLYENAQKEIQELRSQHESDIDKMLLLEKQVGQLQSKGKILAPTITELQAKDILDQSSQTAATTYKKQSEIFNQSLEIGRITERAERFEQAANQCQTELNKARWDIGFRNGLILAISAIGVSALTWVFLRRGDLQRNQFPLYQETPTPTVSVPVSDVNKPIEGGKVNQPALPKPGDA